MERFMSHRHLARDSRFRRADNRNQLMRSLPDDVAEIVRVFERIAPKIFARVEGTSLEAVYDELGPGFQFLIASGGRQSKDGGRTPMQLKTQLHGIFVGHCYYYCVEGVPRITGGRRRLRLRLRLR